MADSATNLDTIAVGQGQKETTANALFNAGSPATYFGLRKTVGLTWHYYGGIVDPLAARIQNGSLNLTASQTCYIEHTTAGAVSFNTSAFTVGRIPDYIAVTDTDEVSSHQDVRSGGPPPGGPFDVMGFYPGIPTASAIVVRVPLARAVSFAANFAGSYGRASAAATASTAFDIQKNGSSVGTMTFALGATTATFVSAGGTAQSFAAGDVLSIVSPASPDATLANIGIALAGTR